MNRLQTELAALDRMLEAENEEKERKEAEIESKRAALHKLVTALNGCPEEAVTLEEKLTAETQRSADVSKEVSNLQDDAREAVLEALEGARTARARRCNESGRFHYVLAYNGQVGSIPRSVLASAPDSVLYKTYCGTWDYARDGEGRAIVTCHPDRWAAVLEHLTTGAVPTQRDSPLLEQARFWNLRTLVERLEALTPGVSVANDPDEKGFTARFTFVPVMSRFDKGEELSFTYATPGKRWWKLNVEKDGIFQCALSMPDQKVKAFKVRTRFQLLLRDEPINAEWTLVDSSEPKYKMGWGYRWSTIGYSIHQLVSEPLARAQDSLVLQIEARYVDE